MLGGHRNDVTCTCSSISELTVLQSRNDPTAVQFYISFYCRLVDSVLGEFKFVKIIQGPVFILKRSKTM